MQRRLSALTIWIVVAALVRGLAVTNLDHCGQSTLPGTDEIVCLCQFDDYHQDLDDIDLQTMIRVEYKTGKPCDPSNFHTSSDTTVSTAFAFAATSDEASTTPTSTATPEKELHPEGFLRSILCNFVDRAGYYHPIPASVVSTTSAETNGEGKASSKSRRHGYTKDSASLQKIRLFGGIRQRPPVTW